MINKKAGFWIRFLARVIDLVFVSSIAIASAYLMMNHTGGWHFKENWMYYVWNLELVSMLILWFIVIPSFWGKTVFMWVFRIEIQFENNNRILSMLKREFFYSLEWIFMLLFIMAVVNHTMITKFAKSDQDGIVYSDLEKLRIGIVSAVGSILMMIQFIYSISIFVRGPKKGLHDTQSNTWTVWTNKFTEIEKKVTKKTIRPMPINNTPVIWVD